MNGRAPRGNPSAVCLVRRKGMAEPQAAPRRLPVRPRALLPLAPAPPALLVSLEGVDKISGALSVAAAWEIAMAWETPLRNKVRLVTARDGPIDSILDSYAWVLFDAQDTEEISVARAAAVAWFLLSCCPGYCGRENPVFWKCVFSALSRSVLSSEDLKLDRDIWSVNDAIGFFDQPGHEFPRFMVDGRRLGLGNPYLAEVRLFIGVGGEWLLPTTNAQLKEIVVRLDPFIDSKQLANRHPDVCIARLPGNRRHTHTNPYVPALQRLLSALKNPTVGDDHVSPSQVVFRLKEIRFSFNYSILCDAHAEMLYDIMSAERVDIGRFQWDMAGPVRPSPSGSAKLVKCLLALDRDVIQAKTTTIQLISWNNPVFEPFVSALPFASSMHTIRYTAPSHRQTFDDHDLPWLAYAMFHPDAETSSWRSLQLDDVALTQQSIAVMNAMARGNNLLTLLHGSRPTSDAYFRARLVAGTRVTAEPSDAADVLVTTCDAFEWVDVCGIDSLDPATWSDWVAVILPAYGLGWVRSQDLQDVEGRAPSQSTLRALTLRQRSIEMDNDHQILAEFVASFGSSLQYLNIEGYCEMRSVPSLQRILTRCPALEVLEVGHSGELWSSGGAPEGNILAHLKQLHLHLSYPPVLFHKPTLDHLRSSLSQLEALRIQPESYFSITESHEALAFVLTHAHKLHVLHWGSGLQNNGTGTPRLYGKTLETSSSLLKRIEFPNHLHLLVHGNGDQIRLAAFLSVVYADIIDQERVGQPDRKRVVGRLNVDMLVNVFQFVLSRARRTIVLEPSTKEIVDGSSFRFE